MRTTPIKLLAFASAITLGFAATNTSFAETAVVNVDIVINNVITLTVVDSIDFGTWALVPTTTAVVAAGLVLTLDAALGTVAVTNTDTDEVAVSIVAPSAGHMTVATPAAATVFIGGAPGTQPLDTTLVLSAPSYQFGAGGTVVMPASVAAAKIATTSITTVGGNTAETVNFGGVITALVGTVSGTNVATVDVEFSY